MGEPVVSGERTCKTRSHGWFGPTLRRGFGNKTRKEGNNATIFKEKCERKLEFPGRWIGRG